jgi:hypothetical protein
MILMIEIVLRNLRFFFFVSSYGEKLDVTVKNDSNICTQSIYNCSFIILFFFINSFYILFFREMFSFEFCSLQRNRNWRFFLLKFTCGKFLTLGVVAFYWVHFIWFWSVFRCYSEKFSFLSNYLTGRFIKMKPYNDQ